MGVIHGAVEENNETEPEYGPGAWAPTDGSVCGPHTAEEKTENGGRPLAAVVARAVVARVTHGSVGADILAPGSGGGKGKGGKGDTWGGGDKGQGGKIGMQGKGTGKGD